MSAPAIPDRRELFCHYCNRHKPRDQIVEAKRIRNGQQTVYRCRSCGDRMRALKAAEK